MTRETIPADEVLTKAHAVGQYYGFTPLSILTAEARHTASVAGEVRAPAAKANETPATLDPVAETVASFLRQCHHGGILPLRQPLFIWHTNIAPGRAAQKKAVVQFHAFGSDHALADVVVIRALVALVRDLYHEEPVVRVNSMGDRETRARYARELANFFKKRGGSLPEECVLRARHNVFEAAELVLLSDCADELPAPSEHLSDASRKRFEDLLEYLEMTETPYEFARTLLSRASAWNDTCFELICGDRRVAWGSRYHELTRQMLGPTMSATGAVFHVATNGSVVKKVAAAKARFSFVHIGDEAKRISLRLAEDFRKARLPLIQNIGIQSLTEQFTLAERRNSPYLLIMGRKEALENTAILRNRATQEEYILPLEGIIEHLRAIV